MLKSKLVVFVADRGFLVPSFLVGTLIGVPGFSLYERVQLILCYGSHCCEGQRDEVSRFETTQRHTVVLNTACDKTNVTKREHYHA
jgi:hypothetical protein